MAAYFPANIALAYAILFIVAALVETAPIPGASHRLSAGSGKINRAAETSTPASPASWSKKTSLAPSSDSAILPFVTSRVERVPRPEGGVRKKASLRDNHVFRTTAKQYPSENSIEHGTDLRSPSKRKSKQRTSGGSSHFRPQYDNFGNGGGPSAPVVFYRRAPGMYGENDSYGRNPGYDPTASVRSPTISVSPLRYKIIDMGDPWVGWDKPQASSNGYGYHERRRPFQNDDETHYRPAPSSMSPYKIFPHRGGYGQHQFGVEESTAYSDLQESVIDPFRRYAQRDNLPWSVQVGTSLTVKDDGRQSRRGFYVRSQRNAENDDFRG